MNITFEHVSAPPRAVPSVGAERGGREAGGRRGALTVPRAARSRKVSRGRVVVCTVGPAERAGRGVRVQGPHAPLAEYEVHHLCHARQLGGRRLQRAEHLVTVRVRVRLGGLGLGLGLRL
eukprot:scaffold5478_cov63-Phaeocystis_antarctica.AAC.4